jgi:hydroxymethylbilane synthase
MLIRIATRRSALALAQSRWVAARLSALEPGLRVELHEFVTRGDRVQDRPLTAMDGKGLFTREIEEALLNGAADLAVHSLKDLPAAHPEGLVLAAVPEREDPRDALVLPSAAAGALPALGSLPAGARVGSGSPRRAAQLLAVRPDLHVRGIRGNVDTRLRKLDSGEYDALILAAAGLRRLGLAGRIAAPLAPEEMLPAPGQGALALQCRTADAGLRALLARLDCPGTRACITAERALLAALGGGCGLPLGALAEREGDAGLRLRAAVTAPGGRRSCCAAAAGTLQEAAELGRAVARQLLTAGATALITEE